MSATGVDRHAGTSPCRSSPASAPRKRGPWHGGTIAALTGNQAALIIAAAVMSLAVILLPHWKTKQTLQDVPGLHDHSKPPQNQVSR
jgi:hypothetical protein